MINKLLFQISPGRANAIVHSCFCIPLWYYRIGHSSSCVQLTPYTSTLHQICEFSKRKSKILQQLYFEMSCSILQIFILLSGDEKALLHLFCKLSEVNIHKILGRGEEEMPKNSQVSLNEKEGNQVLLNVYLLCAKHFHILHLTLYKLQNSSEQSITLDEEALPWRSSG